MTSRRRSSRTRAAAAVVVLSMLGASVAGAVAAGLGSREELGTRLERRLLDARDGSSFRLADVTPFAWDTAAVFGPYTPPSTVSAVVGAPVPARATEAVQATDDVCLVVLVRDGAVVGWTTVDRDVADCARAPETLARRLTPASAVLTADLALAPVSA